MKCSECGANIDYENSFCPECGKPLKGKQKIKADEKYCSGCGEIIKKKAEVCPKCGVRQKVKNPNVALTLAIFFGGFAYFYTSNWKKALIISSFQLFFILLVRIVSLNYSYFFLAYMGSFVIWIYSIINIRKELEK